MKETQVTREITQLNNDYDTFLFFDRTKKDFVYPLHFHPEYELNFVKNSAGAKRIVGDSIETIDDYELCLVGPNLYHVWENGNCDLEADKRKITIQFVANIFSPELLQKDIFAPIAKMLKDSQCGLKFSYKTTVLIEPMLEKIGRLKGFEAFLQFMQVLHQLAVSDGQRTLSNASFHQSHTAVRDERIERVYYYLQQKYGTKIKLQEVADVVNMSPMSFTRLLKQRTGKSFVVLLNDIRLGVAARMMVDSDKTIAEICFACGFNNISNFNRLFKKKHGLTPSDFRRSVVGTKTVM